MADLEQEEVLCHRCGAILTPGRGDLYVVRIEAMADPTGPSFSAEELARLDPAEEIERLIRQMQDIPEQELMDMVYRRLTLYLCGPCYRKWIEDPAGG